MQPPTFAWIRLFPPAGTACAGGAFGLQDAARESEIVAVDGWEAEVREGQRVVVARGGTDDNYDDALRSGLMHAQRALDLMSLRGGNNLVIKGFDDDHLAWWPGPDGLVIRIVSLAPIRIDVPPVTVTTTDASGNVVPPPATPRILWHESFRYFRLSQTTDDLFDAYRNAYLALESVLSSIAPQLTNAAGKVTEGEGAWFKRALMEADKVVPLSSVVSLRTLDPVQHLFDELYVDMRSAMSHAKSGRKILLPQDEAERQDVTESLRRLIALYLRLAEKHLGARRSGGGMFAIAFRRGMSPTLEQMKLYASDDESPFDKSDTIPNLAAGTLKELSATGPADTSRPFVVTRIWAERCAVLADLPFVKRVVGMLDDKPGIAAVLDGRLVLGSAHTLEVMLGVRGSNSRQPRDRYSL
jgi:hypothetical protein